MKSRVLSVLLGLALFVLAAPLAMGAEPVVLRVVVLQTDDVDGYLKELEKGKAILKRIQSPGVIRAWRARFAGENAGGVVVSVEYPSMTAFANDDAKTAADPEYRAWIKNLDKLRKIVSDSLYTELKP